jgi:hypothetical protein
MSEVCHCCRLMDDWLDGRMDARCCVEFAPRMLGRLKCVDGLGRWGGGCGLYGASCLNDAGVAAWATHQPATSMPHACGVLSYKF